MVAVARSKRSEAFAIASAEEPAASIALVASWYSRTALAKAWMFKEQNMGRLSSATFLCLISFIIPRARKSACSLAHLSACRQVG